RIVGDGGLFFYVQDIIVKEKYRGNGFSRLIMDDLLEYLRGVAKKGAFVGLFSVKGVEPLYESYGFVSRPNDTFGAGMFIPVENLMKIKQNQSAHTTPASAPR
ncbi:GNAT family N-acetyltransferase, partial [Pelagicoccus sp. SDUM812003]|uniref:GNAT family N-acetyltransferase n=1 Tax=Pelagicoccus sp. SDUM812003 TaxID=3041267 RepID=UPI00280EAC13